MKTQGLTADQMNYFMELGVMANDEQLLPMKRHLEAQIASRAGAQNKPMDKTCAKRNVTDAQVALVSTDTVELLRGQIYATLAVVDQMTQLHEAILTVRAQVNRLRDDINAIAEREEREE